MLNTIATLGLGALLATFAVYAVMLNEAEHAARRRRRRAGIREARQPLEEGPLETLDPTAVPGPRRDGRRLPVGDFLFGALYLRGEEPLPFAELAAAAADSGLDAGQTLTWLARVEESGLVERVDQPASEEGAAARPAVRLTAAGMERARNNRRAAPASVRTAP